MTGESGAPRQNFPTGALTPDPAEPEPRSVIYPQPCGAVLGEMMSQSLVERYKAQIAGTLSCYDRMVVTGTLLLSHHGRT